MGKCKRQTQNTSQKINCREITNGFYAIKALWIDVTFQMQRHRQEDMPICFFIKSRDILLLQLSCWFQGQTISYFFHLLFSIFIEVLDDSFR